ncbi:carboxypeptidase-like regulatory domain-containing protein [Chryseobacterium sp. PMSZPI]|uniref:carboxypeptidase-like regulatory domain-containing protein n=1 Tax=Chryseobacterium sp. PMSZPI TaxID=1033900 RepID=UPI0039A2B5A9
MKTYKKNLYFSLLFISATALSQQKITGTVTDNSNKNINPVLIINVSRGLTTFSDTSGKFVIDAGDRDEIRFVKEGYYRFSKQISKDDFNSPLLILLRKMEIEIPEVKIAYKPTGNLERDSKHLNGSRKLSGLKSDLEIYMKSPLNEPLPNNAISKTFTGHDFNAGQVDLFGVFNAASGLFKKITKPKITKPTYNETQLFMDRLKKEVNLDFLKKYGMGQEQIDAFLIYADDTRNLAKKYRKDFNKDVIESEVKIAFAEYRKVNKIDGQ